jgi:hypothetical protein
VTQPTAHYRQHHDVEAPRVDRIAFRPAWRVRTRLDQLLAHRAIRAQDWHRAVALRDDLELVLRAAYPATPEPGVPSGSRHETPLPAISRFDALARVGAICARLGEFACMLLRHALVDDPTWVALGAWLRVDPRTARSWVVRCIKALADPDV